ncbi:MAG: class I SAM-dependent methyltransferase [Actinobacteria bacterium]|nr:class I SAM-dependent methyltransferase [Actinomycetota bacterium]
MAVIPFYGSDDPDLFAIERGAMDREGRVIAALDENLPTTGTALDVGAGDGFTAERLTTRTRNVVALEPAAGMIRRDRRLAWVQGEAECLPFADASFGAAYATWAYFFSRNWDPSPGLRELHRVVRRGGPLLIVDNLGSDEFSALSLDDMSADTEFWVRNGFACLAIDTHFDFENMTEARALLELFFGETGGERAALRLSFRVGLFVGRSSGCR